MTVDRLVKSLGYDTYTLYDEYTPITKRQMNTMYDKYFRAKKEEEMVKPEVTVTVGKQTYRAVDVEIHQSCGEYPEIELSAMMSPYNKVPNTNLSIKEVIFNPPATIVFWSDNTKTVVKADYGYDSYDPEKGIAMAISKKMLGDNKYEYYNTFKHWLKKWNKQCKTDDFIEYLEKNIPDEDED